jgi:hypothetical protein
MEDADVFVGLSVGNVVTPEMLKTMARNPVIFALANPDPEIAYEAAVEARPDAIIATGRSDCPNQVNNVLGFPFIFRGALDVRAMAINEPMKLAATRALAALAKEDVPDSVLRAYGVDRIEFGRHYIIPKPFDQRVLISVAPAVAQAAMDSGVAAAGEHRQYQEQLRRRLGKAHEVMRVMVNKAQRRSRWFSRGRSEQDPACLPDPDRRADRQAHSPRRRGAHLGQNLRPALAPGRRGRRRSGAHAGAGGLCRGVLPTAPSQGSDAQRGCRADLEQERVRRSHGAHGRRGRAYQAHGTLSDTLGRFKCWRCGRD